MLPPSSLAQKTAKKRSKGSPVQLPFSNPFIFWGCANLDPKALENLRNWVAANLEDSTPLWKKAHAWETVSFQTYKENKQISCMENNVIQSHLAKQANIMRGKKCNSKLMWKISKSHAWETMSFQTYVENKQILSRK